MIKLSGSELAEGLIHDFEQTIENSNQSKKILLKNGDQVFFMDGLNSKHLYDDLFSQITKAQHQIEIISPYVSEPFLGHLRQFGSQVTIYTPSENNKSGLKQLMLSVAKTSGFSVFEDQRGMSHLKAILIDESTLIFGSSNFDFVSYYCEQEVIYVTTNSALIESFKESVLIPLKKHSKRFNFDDFHSKPNTILINFAIRFLRIYSKMIK
jgi:phosphatidylserine/phosphatidylglycerophosphate/cardiolipin synthase-like enzyme